MGQLDVHIRHGGGGGGDIAGLIGPVALAVVVVIVVEWILSVIVWLAVAFGVVAFLAVALLTWWLITNPARKARHDEAYRAGAARLRAADEAKALQRQAFALELARASAPVINNIIDPAALVAAALAGAKPQPVTIRAEVER